MTKHFKAKYEAKLEFSDGEALEKNFHGGGME